jgi:hypothetical protein
MKWAKACANEHLLIAQCFSYINEKARSVNGTKDV